MTVKGIEVTGIIYDNEDETARSTATEAASTAKTASQTATTASETATQASETATQADAKASENANAITELQGDIEDIQAVIPSVATSTNKLITNNEMTNAITSKLNVINGTRNSNIGATVTFLVPSYDFFLVVGGWNTSGSSYRALYYISTEPRGNTVIVKSISTALGETPFTGTITGTFSKGATTLSITAGTYENIASVVRAFYAEA